MSRAPGYIRQLSPTPTHHQNVSPLSLSSCLSGPVCPGFLIYTAARDFPIMMTLLYFYPSALTTNVIMIELHEELLNIITIILTTTSGLSWPATDCPVLLCVLSEGIITTMFIFISLLTRKSAGEETDVSQVPAH